MSKHKTHIPQNGPRQRNVSPTYRGVHIQETGGMRRFSSKEIRQAVRAAIAKNADALAGKA